ncbi:MULTISPECIES: trypsin-like peptidase domain-containing protein [unclassified Microcoleus]|uniref:trypsin-like peptidase domain-containing protein n=1 Tax=unclassified Microcoleus TaxID=2642155 RepID=UPI0025DE0485|nr:MULTISPECIES: trypsin-like peptidase domain-containing protein [unclassified Microcoleus]
MNFKLLSLAVSGIFIVGVAARAAAVVKVPPGQQKANLAEFNSVPRTGPIAENAEEQTNIRVYEKASPAVVTVDTAKSNGSGTIISPDGMVLTNAHVVSAGGTVNIILSDGRKLVADVVGFGEEGLDLAVVKIRGQNNLPTIPLARAGSVKVGQQAFAIGNPFGRFQGTFTVGIVSRIDAARGLIQTDAAINPGNSGGPLLNSSGELIGVNTSIFTRGQGGGNIGIGFAIVIDKVPAFLSAVREGRAPRVAQRRSPFGNKSPQKVALNGPAVTGKLTDKSSILPADNSFFDLYSFEGKAGQQITIEMKSQEIDPYLILLGPNEREIAQDDNGAGNKNARITVRLPADGTYTLLANSNEARQLGAYTLELKASAPSAPSRAILQEEGALVAGGPVLPSDNSLYREYTFEGRSGQSVSISLESTDFDPYVAIFDPNGKLVAENDDASDSSKNAFLSVTLPATGRYRVIVNAYDASGRGRYNLTIR